MKAKKLLALAGVSVAGAFLLAACGGGSSNQATYSFVYSADPNTLDYIAATRTTTSDVTSNLVDGLLVKRPIRKLCAKSSRRLDCL